MRTLFWVLNNFAKHINVYHPYQIMNLIAPMVIGLIYPFMLMLTVLNINSNDILTMLGLLFLLSTLILGKAFNSFARVYNPEQIINNIYVVPLLGVWAIIDGFFLTLLSLATFDSDNWGTRDHRK